MSHFKYQLNPITQPTQQQIGFHVACRNSDPDKPYDLGKILFATLLCWKQVREEDAATLSCFKHQQFLDSPPAWDRLESLLVSQADSPGRAADILQEQLSQTMLLVPDIENAAGQVPFYRLMTLRHEFHPFQTSWFISLTPSM